jgi:hypothetical protein
LGSESLGVALPAQSLPKRFQVREMPVIKVAKRTALADPETLELNQIREEWTASNSHLAAEVLMGACSMSACRTMPFVTLQTSSGPKALCLRHFEKLRMVAA